MHPFRPENKNRKKMFRNLLIILSGLLLAGASCSNGSEEPTPAPNPDPMPSTPTQLAAPLPLELSDLTTDNGFTVQWSAVAHADSYVYTVDGGEEKSTTDTRLALTGLAAETTYTVKVKARSDNPAAWSESGWGAVTVKTKAGTSPAPERKEYKLVWSDEFDGSTLDTESWNYQIGGDGYGNQEKQHYTDRPENVRLEEGCLVIEARKEVYGKNSYTSGRINTKNKRSFAYGKIEARIQLPKGRGTWPAFWMLGANYDVYQWPRCGEIDIMEHVGKEPTMISHALHTFSKNGSNGQNWNARKYIDDIEEGFHTYTLVWEKDWDNGDDMLQFLVDDQVTATYYQPHGSDDDYKAYPFNKEFFLIFNIAVGGTWGGTIDDSIFANPVLMKVDYVRVYQRVE